jgi:hypothetical protein
MLLFVGDVAAFYNFERSFYNLKMSFFEGDHYLEDLFIDGSFTNYSGVHQTASNNFLNQQKASITF